METQQEQNNLKSPVPYGEDRLRQDIRDFVGKDGYIPFEHGYRPAINAYAVDYEGIYLRAAEGAVKKKRILKYEDMDTKMLTAVILDLFRYLNYCQLYA